MSKHAISVRRILPEVYIADASRTIFSASNANGVRSASWQLRPQRSQMSFFESPDKHKALFLNFH
jgi:hypothetical protein